MNNPVCQNCAHFRQHYIMDVQWAQPVHCGHCTYPRLKNRKPDTPACKFFSSKATPDCLPDRAEAIQFLTVDVVKKIMELTLPPAIRDYKKE